MFKVGDRVRVKDAEIEWIGIGTVMRYAPTYGEIEVRFTVNGGVTLPFYDDELEKIEDKIHKLSLCRPWKT